MAIRKILTEQDRALRLKSRPVTQITPHILELLDDLTETMRRADGCGLAAPQVGVLRRVVVVETEPGEVYELINPEITNRQGTQRVLEGCLSIPGKQGFTVRPEQVTVRALARDGKTYEYTAHGLLAQAFCHEIDHLDGILFTDHAEMLTPQAQTKEN